MPITLKKDVWKVKDPSSGQYRGAAILSTTLPQDAAQIISESNDTIQNIKDTAIEAVDTALNDESTGLIPKAEADRDAIDDSLNNTTDGIIPTAQSNRDDIDDSLNNIEDGIIPTAQANLATIAQAVQSQIGQGTDKTLSVAKGFADAKAAGMLVKVSDYQPGSALDDPRTSQDTSQNTGYPVYKDSNRVWVKETYAELEVPTMDDVDELKSALLVSANPSLNWNQGGIIATTGEETTSDSRIKTDIFYCGGIIRAVAAYGYKVGVALYDADKNFDTWDTGFKPTVQLYAANYCRLIVARTNDSVISPTEGNNISCLIDLRKTNAIDPDIFGGNDTEKLQSAFDYCENSGGTIILNRKFTVKSSIIIKHLYEKQNRVIVQGTSPDAAIVFSSYYCFRGNSSSTGGIVFRDIKITKETGGYAFLYGGSRDQSSTSYNKTIVNIIFENCYIYGFATLYYAENYVQSLWLLNCIIRNMAGGIINTSGYQWYNVNICRCVIEGTKGIGRISYAEAVNIRDCVIEGNQNSAKCIIVDSAAYDLNIEGNYFELNSEDINMLDLTTEHRNIRIVGNYFDDSSVCICLPNTANQEYESTITIMNNRYHYNNNAGYMIIGNSEAVYNEVFCAFNSGKITNLPNESLKVLIPSNFF